MSSRRSEGSIRPARPGEADALTALAMRSKAHWGYDAEFMARARSVLTVTPDMIGDGRAVVLEDGPLAGITARAIVILDEADKVVYTEMVPEIVQEPDYDKALSAL